MEYKITFITLDFNKNAVIIYARNESEAKRKFENDYQYSEIDKIEIE